MTSELMKIVLMILAYADLNSHHAMARGGERIGTWRNGTRGPYYPGSCGASYGILYAFSGYSYYSSQEYYLDYSARESRSGCGLAPAAPNSSRCYVAPRRVVSASGAADVRHVRVCHSRYKRLIAVSTDQHKDGQTQLDHLL
jgi:hypothetical protein